MNSLSSLKPVFVLGCLLFAFTFAARQTFAQNGAATKEKETYSQLKAFALTGGAVQVKALVLKKDRAQITLDGTVYLSAAVNGQTTGAVFIGEGRFAAETPPSSNDFEKGNVKRLLGTENVESDFNTAVFRFTDDTAAQFGQSQPSLACILPAIQLTVIP